MTYAKVRKSSVMTLFYCKCFVFWLENATSERVWNLLANLSFQHKIKIYLVKKLDSSHWINFWFFIRFLMRLSQKCSVWPSITTQFALKTISYVQSKWITNHHKRWQKTKYFFSEGAYAQHKRRTYNLKGPRADRTCLVTLKRGLLTIQLVGFKGAA